MFRFLPLILLGVVLVAYWGRVLRMAQKVRQRTGRAANFVPRERVGRMIRIIWMPVVAIWVAHPFITAFVHAPKLLRPLYFNPWIAWPALIMAAMCLILTRLCWKKMGRDWRMGIDPAENNPLIATGPFARVRHPIYALSGLMMLATMAMIPSPVMLAAGLIHLALLGWEARREEQHMLRLHGDQYVRYQKTVGGFFPRGLLRS